MCLTRSRSSTDPRHAGTQARTLRKRPPRGQAIKHTHPTTARPTLARRPAVKRLTLCAGLCLLAVAAARAQSYPLAGYFPVFDNQTHTYDYENSEGLEGEMTRTVEGPFPAGADTAYRVETRLGDLWTRHYLKWDADFLRVHRREYSLGDVADYSNPGEFLPAWLADDADDLTLGDGGAYAGETYTGEDTAEITCYGIETITVPAGEFPALHARVVTDWQDDDGYHGYDDVHYWLAAGIGVVRRTRSENLYDPNEEGWNQRWDRWELREATPTHTVSGWITGESPGDVLVSFHQVGGAPAGFARSDEQGFYSFSPLANGWDGAVSASDDGAVYSPVAHDIADLDGDLADRNFSPLLAPKELADYLVGRATLTPEQRAAADRNGDGRLDIADLVSLH